jgi:hypothetical protein
MNCFNIRELQGILKRRFFTDLVNSHDYKDILNTTMLGLKYKFNEQTNLNLDSTLFYNWGILKSPVNNIYKFKDLTPSHTRNFSSYFDIYVHSFLKITVNFSSMFYYLTTYFINFINLFFSLFSFIPFIFSFFSATIFNTFFVGVTGVFLVNSTCIKFSLSNVIYSVTSFLDKDSYASSFLTKTISADEALDKFSFLEHSKHQRSTRFTNSLISYDYKTGHYLGSSEKYYPYLILSFLEVARGIRKPT